MAEGNDPLRSPSLCSALYSLHKDLPFLHSLERLSIEKDS